jgi:hypothetical protein
MDHGTEIDEADRPATALEVAASDEGTVYEAIHNSPL